MSVNIVQAPTISLTGKVNANAGGVYTLSLGAVNDPGNTVSQYTVNWGDGQNSNYTTNGNVTHTYASPGPDNISVDLTDNTGLYTSAGSLGVIVTQPSVDLGGAAGVFQGQSYSLTINTANDAGGTPQQYVVHWGDGTSNTWRVIRNRLTHFRVGMCSAACRVMSSARIWWMTRARSLTPGQLQSRSLRLRR